MERATAFRELPTFNNGAILSPGNSGFPSQPSQCTRKAGMAPSLSTSTMSSEPVAAAHLSGASATSLSDSSDARSRSSSRQENSESPVHQHLKTAAAAIQLMEKSVSLGPSPADQQRLDQVEQSVQSLFRQTQILSKEFERVTQVERINAQLRLQNEKIFAELARLSQVECIAEKLVKSPLSDTHVSVLERVARFEEYAQKLPSQSKAMPNKEAERLVNLEGAVSKLSTDLLGLHSRMCKELDDMRERVTPSHTVMARLGALDAQLASLICASGSGKGFAEANAWTELQEQAAKLDILEVKHDALVRMMMTLDSSRSECRYSAAATPLTSGNSIVKSDLALKEKLQRPMKCINLVHGGSEEDLVAANAADESDPVEFSMLEAINHLHNIVPLLGRHQDILNTHERWLGELRRERQVWQDGPRSNGLR